MDGEIAYNRTPKTIVASGWIFQEKKRRKLWIQLATILGQKYC